MSAIIDGAFQLAYIRRFFHGTGACQSIFEDITSTLDEVSDVTTITINLNGQTPVPQDVMDELTEDCPPFVKLVWLRNGQPIATCRECNGPLNQIFDNEPCCGDLDCPACPIL